MGKTKKIFGLKTGTVLIVAVLIAAGVYFYLPSYFEGKTNEGLIMFVSDGDDAMGNVVDTSASMTFAGQGRTSQHRSMSFSGDGDYVKIHAFDEDGFPAEEFTVALWVNLDCDGVVDANDGYVLDGFNSQRDNLFMRCISPTGNNDGANFQIQHHARDLDGDGNGRYVAGGRHNIINNEWNHIVATFNSKTLSSKTYINGEMITDDIISRPEYSPVGQIMEFGKEQRGSPSGQMDDIMLWDRELTKTEVKYLFKNEDFEVKQ